MAQPRRTPHTRSNHYPLRHAPDPRKRAFSSADRPLHSSKSSATESPPPSSRAVLIPLHLNLRRLPSRLLIPQTESMRNVASNKQFVQAGTKRKRSVSGAENVTAGARVIRGAGKYKRHKSAQDSSDENAGSAMEVDAQGSWTDSGDSKSDDSSGDSSDEYYLNDASSRELLRLRKDELVRLYSAAGLSEDVEHLTKHDLVQAIISARDDVASVPPSSPSGFTSSDGSSDDGHFAGGEETDIGTRFGLRRRVTVQTMEPLARTRQAVTGRTMSLGQIDKSHIEKLKVAIAKYPALASSSTSSSDRSSPSVSTFSTGLPSPPITRQRTRKVPADHSSHVHTRDKGKQVEFNREVEIVDLGENNESDLADLADPENCVSPSPRRLRSKGEKIEHRTDSNLNRKVTSRRKVRHRTEPSRQKDEDEEPVASDDEHDELLSSPTQSAASEPSTSRGRRTPVKHRLRPRPAQTHTPPSDGDDEEESDETALDESQSGSAEDDDQTDELATPMKPLRLRNGKVVSNRQEAVEEDELLADENEDVQQDDEDGESVLSESTSEIEAQVEVLEEEDDEIDEEGRDGTMDDFDLSTASIRSLTRFRRDDLVKLCEGRDLDVSGTKAQLAKALLEWRDRPSSESCPSSTGTVRPSETSKLRATGRRRSHSKCETPVQTPQTPPASNERDFEPELELDLESLGLHDREIPPDKIIKLEKIGSGGFKDVFVGKLKGRKVAIAEFRGQLNAMDIKELKLLGDFSHPNIVRFLGVSIPENTRETPVMIISELCSNGDLFDYIRGPSSIPTLRRMVCMMLDIARGLQYLHAHKPSVIHRDCKSSNILITSKGVAKITDFGLAKVKQSTRSMVRSLVGTVNWQAPELWHPHPKYNHKVDVFSCAMVFWEMLQWHLPSKKFPWEGMNEHAIYDLVGAKRQRPSTAGLRKQWHPEILDLIEHMWAQEHQDRPTMIEVVERLEGFFNRF